MRKILYTLTIMVLLAGTVSCDKNDVTPKSSMPLVSMSIIPDYSDGSVYSYSDDGSFFLKVSVTPKTYIDKLINNGGFVCKADFRSVITKAAEENPDFTVVGEITSASVEEGYMTASFTLSEEEMEKMWDADYVVSFSMEDTDGTHGVSTSFVPVSWHKREGSGGDEVVVEIEGHKVTVRLSDDEADAGIADDLILQVKSSGSSVIVKTYSDSGKPLIIRNDNTTLIAPVEDGNISIFTISNITSDITATLAYAKTISVSASYIADLMPNVDGYFKDFAEGEEQFIEGREYEDYDVTIKINDVAGYRLDSLVCGETKVFANTFELKNITSDKEIRAYFTYTDWLKGEFSVSDGKKVRFSRGNLWCKGTGSEETPTIESWGFESNQYESTPSSKSERTISHISHFMWCKSAEESVKLVYEEGTATDNLFTNKDATSASPNFAVNGQKQFWRVLSGNNGGGFDGGEWGYLVNPDNKYGQTVRSGKSRSRVTVCGHTECLILLPDDWEWDAGTVGNGWQSEYSESTTVKWSTMESYGAVCLPASGRRLGSPEYLEQLRPIARAKQAMATVVSIDYQGNYWSSTPSPNRKGAWSLVYALGHVSFNGTSLFIAQSIRLVADYQGGPGAE